MQEMLTTTTAFLAKEFDLVILLAGLLFTAGLTYLLWRHVRRVTPTPQITRVGALMMSDEERHLYARIALADVLSDGFEKAVRDGVLTRDEATQYAKRVYKALGVSEHIPSWTRISPIRVRSSEEVKTELAQVRATRKAKEKKPNKLLQLLTRRSPGKAAA